MKRDDRELLETIVVFFAAIIIVFIVGLLSLHFLSWLGIHTQVQLPDSNDLVWTAPGYAALMFGFPCALLAGLIFYLKKPDGWVLIYIKACAGIFCSWLVLVFIGRLIDIAFGYDEGLHQIFATLSWIIVVFIWIVVLYFVFSKLYSRLSSTS